MFVYELYITYMWYMLMGIWGSSSYCMIENCNSLFVSYVNAVALGNVQWKRRFTMAECGMLISSRNNVNPVQDEPFLGYLWIGREKVPLPKICHSYRTMIKLSMVIPYLKKIQKNINHVMQPLSSIEISIF